MKPHLPSWAWKASLLAAIVVVSACHNDTKAPLDPVQDSASARVQKSPPSDPPPFEGSCARDTDCGLGNFGPDCCVHCKFFEGSKVWINRMDSFCRGPGLNLNCPVNDCPIQMADPKCLDGHCRLALH